MKANDARCARFLFIAQKKKKALSLLVELFAIEKLGTN